MPNLQVKISGLCLFAFDSPLKGGKAPTGAKLLLQKLTHARPLSKNPNQRQSYEVLDQHFPLLVFNLTERDAASSRPTDFFATPGSDGKQMTKGVCVLFGDDVEIRPDGNGGNGSGLQLDNQEPKDPNNPTPEELKSLSWMATLQDAFPVKNGQPAVTIDPIFSENPPGANQAIVARVVLRQGLLTTDQLTPRICTFVPPGNPKFSKRIAISFNWDIPFKEKVVIQTTKRIEGRIVPSELVLTPSGHGGGDLTIEIKNMEIDELIGIQRSYSPRPEADFEVYADLLKNRPPSPTYIRQVGPGNPAGITNSTCPPSGG
jgi:hypothetical protein